MKILYPCGVYLRYSKLPWIRWGIVAAAITGEAGFYIAALWLISSSNVVTATLKQIERTVELRETLDADTTPMLRVTGVNSSCDGVTHDCTIDLIQPYDMNGVSKPWQWTPKILAPFIQETDSSELSRLLNTIGDGAIKT